MELPIDIDRLAWDDWNLQHLRDRHQITRQEVEQVLQNEASTAQETSKARHLVLGPAESGRMLAVVVRPVPGDPGDFHTFSAQPAHRKERAFHQAQKELHDDE